MPTIILAVLGYCCERLFEAPTGKVLGQICYALAIAALLLCAFGVVLPACLTH